MNIDYKEKYLKYKNKYLLTKSLKGGIGTDIQKNTLYSNLFNFFTKKNSKNFSNTLFSDIFVNENIVLKIFQTEIFKNKLHILWGIVLGKTTEPKLFKDNSNEFFKTVLNALVYRESLTLKEFNDIVNKL
jgi:hypothetical protein